MVLMRRKPLNPGKGFNSRGGWAGAGLRDEQDEGHYCEPGQAASREQRLADRAARQIESALATANLVPGNVTMTPGAGATGIAVLKENVIESEPYRRLVAELPCFWCGISGYSQHAHLNYGKGLSWKTDDRTGFPLCCSRPGIEGCHVAYDQYRLLEHGGREGHREYGIEAGRFTRANPEGWALAQEAAPVGLISVRTEYPGASMNSTQAKQTSGTSTHRARDGGVDLGTTEVTPTLMLVFEAIRQIHDAGGEPTRERIVAMTGLKPTTVDDRIKVLRGEGMISPLKQCYRPLHQHVAAQAVSCTVMPNGIYKIEKGDEVMTLVPAEARQLAPMLAGKALEASALERVQEMEARMVEMAQQLKEVDRRYKALKAVKFANEVQHSLELN